MQSIQRDSDGIIRFKQNAIVRFLLDKGPFDMDDLANMGFSDQDREQFAQLIGYSVCGYGELPYVSDKSYDSAAEREEAIPKVATVGHHSQP